jgi:hypothetical protein
MAIGLAASGVTAGVTSGGSVHWAPSRGANAAAYELATFRQQASTATHTHPYNYDWLWIVFVIGAVLLGAILITVRIYAGRSKERSSQPQRDQRAEPEDSD